MIAGFWTKALAVARIIGRRLRLRAWGSLLTLLACWFASFQLAAILICVQAAEKASAHPAATGSMIAYIKEGTPATKVSTLAEAIRSRPDVARVTFVSREEGLARMRAWLGPDNPLIQDLDARILPDAFEITIDRAHADKIEATARAVASLDGIGDVRYRKGIIGLIASSFRQVAAIGAGIGSLTALSLGLIIFLSVRVGIISRSGEITVMRLLGASAMFIYTPYIVEGVLYGLIGAASGFGTAYFIVKQTIAYYPALKPLVGPELLGLPAWVIPFGGLCGFTGAVLAGARSTDA